MRYENESLNERLFRREQGAVAKAHQRHTRDLNEPNETRG